ncbi:MAG: PIN domain-containing protein [Methanobacteriota archaeon]
MHRIYLDTNVYCRPRDDRSQGRIDLEAKALEEIARLKEEKKVFIVSSDYVKIEVKEIEDEEKREDVINFERVLCDLNFEHSDEAKTLASKIVRRCSIGVLDALHISAAVLVNAKFFLTCDDDVIAKRVCIAKVLIDKKQSINILNPVDYLKSEWRIKIE